MTMSMHGGFWSERLASHRSRTVLFNTHVVEKDHWASLFRGAVEAFNLSGDTTHCYYIAGSADEADAAAIQNDWETVASDFRAALAGAGSRDE